MTTEPTISLSVFTARNSSRAVILRKGPSKLYRMILWDRDSDRFEDGQWLKARVYEERCDLSPDGAHFLYFALDGRWQREAEGSWTAISKPPYFTALALFPQGDTWGGGGYFLEDRKYVVNTGPDTADIIGKAGPLKRFIPGPDAKPWRQRSPDSLRQGKDWMVEGAQLFRLRDQKRILLRDFTDMAFEPIRAPYDDRPETLPWEPAL